jgi:ATP-dependent Lon protease
MARGSDSTKAKNRSTKQDSDSSNSESDSDSDSFSSKKFRQLLKKSLNKTFPTTDLKNKNKHKLNNKKIEESSDDDNEDDSDYVDEDEDDEESDVDEEEESDADEEEEQPKKQKKNVNNYSIILVNDDNTNNDWDNEDDSDADYMTENEDDPISSSDSESESESKTNKTNTKSYDNIVIDTPILSQLKELLAQNPKNKSIQKCIETYEKDMKKTEKKVRERNCRIFKHMLKDKNKFDDHEYYQTLCVDEQKKIIKELRAVNDISKCEIPYRLSILESNIPLNSKSIAIKKINHLNSMEPMSGEYYKIKNWVDQFMKIPFGKYKTLPISMNDGIDKCNDFMQNAQNILNNAVYGLNDAKMQIMQLLGQFISNPNATGCAIGIHGPPGTGKTSLVKNALSEILCKPFGFIPLGGATDGCFLEGHSFTYEGSTYGKIVQILMDSKCMNPIIYFDELDKVSDCPRGQEIIGILTHLIDTSQNTEFYDKYFTEFSIDLSKCLFIFSYNDENKINPILKDRMYRIKTKGYDLKQKTIIASNYLLPKIREQVNFNSDDIIIPNAALHYIIETCCNKEDGVRNLKRSLEIIFTKLNLYRLMRPNTNLFEEDLSIQVSFPFTVTREMVDKLIKKPEINPSFYMLYS